MDGCTNVIICIAEKTVKIFPHFSCLWLSILWVAR
jgi:hypothetical protein